MPTAVNTKTYTSLPLLNPEMARTGSVRLPGGVNYKAGTFIGYRGTAKQNEQQTLTVAGTGSFRIGTVDGDYTTAIPVAGLNATVIQNALNEILGTGQVVVAGGGPYTITAAGELLNTDLAMFLLDNAGITGGPPTIAETTKGSPGPGVFAELADGVTVLAKGLLLEDTKTDFAGRVLTEFGAGLRFTAPILTFGDVEIKYVQSPTTTLVGQVGRLITGNAITDTGAVIRVGV